MANTMKGKITNVNVDAPDKKVDLTVDANGRDIKITFEWHATESLNYIKALLNINTSFSEYPINMDKAKSFTADNEITRIMEKNLIIRLD